MVSVALVLSTALALLQADATTASQRSAFKQRSLEGASASASGYGEGSVDNFSSLLWVMAGYKTDCSGTPFTVTILPTCAATDDECVSASYDENGNAALDI